MRPTAHSSQQGPARLMSASCPGSSARADSARNRSRAGAGKGEERLAERAVAHRDVDLARSLGAPRSRGAPETSPGPRWPKRQPKSGARGRRAPARPPRTPGSRCVPSASSAGAPGAPDSARPAGSAGRRRKRRSLPPRAGSPRRSTPRPARTRRSATDRAARFGATSLRPWRASRAPNAAWIPLLREIVAPSAPADPPRVNIRAPGDTGTSP